MLHRTKTLLNYELDSLDGPMGGVKDFYFDDRHWTIRYLVANTGNWLTGRQVLISPHALVAAIREEEQIAVDLTRKQIEESPSLASDRPVSRQFEMDYYGYYEWPPYWGGPYAWGSYPYPGPSWTSDGQAAPAETESGDDPHLRSMQQMTGYHIEAADGEIGHVADFVIDDESWAVRYLIVDTRNWWFGKHVLISPQWIDRISWTESKVYVSMPRETIKNAPEYEDRRSISRSYENELRDYYQREGYRIPESIDMSQEH